MANALEKTILWYKSWKDVPKTDAELSDYSSITSMYFLWPHLLFPQCPLRDGFLRPLWNVTLAPSIFSLSFFLGGGNSTKSQQQHVPRQTLSQIRSFNETELRLHVAGSGSAPCKSVLNTEPRLHLLCICFPRA